MEEPAETFRGVLGFRVPINFMVVDQTGETVRVVVMGGEVSFH